MNKYLTLLITCLATTMMAQDVKLIGTPIGSSPSVDYNNGYSSSTTVNTPADAFDGSFDTFFASYERSYTWVGLELDTTYVITRVGWSPRKDGDNGRRRVQLGVFEGANSPDFMDAVPLYIIPARGTLDQMTYADITCTRAFRYVRYIGPNDARCNVAELAFYGHAGEGDDTQFTQLTNLPTVVIHTEGNIHPVDKVTDIPATITIISNDGTQVMTKTGSTRLRGNASMQFDKKPYRIKFDKSTAVLDAPCKAKKWTLINNYGDKTLMRNIIGYDFSRRFGHEYTTFIQPVDVVFNGEYKGCYQLCDQLEVRPGRIDIEEMDSTCIEGEALTGGYHLEMDGYASQEPANGMFYSQRGVGITIKDPADDVILPVQHDYIMNHYNEMERRLWSQNYTDPITGYRSMLDLPSFLRHFIIGELTGNTDTYWSMHMYKHRSNPLIYCGPEWDFDIAFNNDYRHFDVNQKSNWVYQMAGTNKSMVDRIIVQDAGARTDLYNMWKDARENKGLTEENILNLIDSMAAELDQSQQLNFLRWPILSQNVHMNPRSAGSYAGEVQWLKNYISQRLLWIDKKLNYVYTMDVENTPTNPNVNKVLINGHIYIQIDNKQYDILGNLWKEE